MAEAVRALEERRNNNLIMQQQYPIWDVVNEYPIDDPTYTLGKMLADVVQMFCVFGVIIGFALVVYALVV